MSECTAMHSVGCLPVALIPATDVMFQSKATYIDTCITGQIARQRGDMVHRRPRERCTVHGATLCTTSEVDE